MKRVASFRRRDTCRAGFGLVADGELVDCSDAGAAGLIDVMREVGLANLHPPRDAARHRLADIVLLPPVTAPEKIICVGVNYANRNEEYRDGDALPSHPSLFVRFPGSFVGHGQAIIRPKESDQLDYEGEIVLVIGRDGRHIGRGEAAGYIAGFTLANDGTLRDWLRHAKFNITQGKNFDASGSLGPWIVPASEVDFSQPLHLVTRVNGEVRQDDTTASMIFDFGQLIEYISSFTTLKVGDLILTGTPTGAGARFDPPRWLKPGDVVEVEVPEIGVLRNTVAPA
jgi:5-carboxymethyl-2-hydroxymuconate isomerase